MAKEAYYFSHDSNARNDPKIIKLRIKHGWAGYGLFWSLIELLRDQSEYVMQLDYESIAFALQSDSETIKSIINDFGLFEIKQDNFYSKSLLNRMKLKEEKSDKARKAALERWNKDKDAKPMQTHSKRNTTAMQGKESKGKEIKENETLNTESHNEIFRKLWKNQQWLESLCMKWKCEYQDLQDHLNTFRTECIDKDELKVDEKDAKTHFINWVKKGNPIAKTEGYKKSTLKDNWF